MPDIQPLVERDAVRAELISDALEVLLMRLPAPGSDRSFWVTPGGGLLAKESPEAGLQRELCEELGLADAQIGPLLLRRDHTFDWLGRRIRQRERLYAVHTQRFVPVVGDELEAKVIAELRWWPLPTLASFPGDLTPRSLHALIERYLEHGPSARVPLEVRVD
jgi:8-oxo-dGTP pyrophosphatase MutT (NUDIX family)